MNKKVRKKTVWQKYESCKSRIPKYLTPSEYQKFIKRLTDRLGV